MISFLLFVSLFVFLPTISNAEPLTHHHQNGYGDPIPYYKVKGTTGSMATEIVDGKLYTLTRNGLRIYDISSPREPNDPGLDRIIRQPM